MITLARLAWQHPRAAAIIAVALAVVLWLASRPGNDETEA